MRVAKRVEWEEERGGAFMGPRPGETWGGTREERRGRSEAEAGGDKGAVAGVDGGVDGGLGLLVVVL